MIQAHAAMALLSGVTHPLVTPTIASKNAFPLAAGWSLKNYKIVEFCNHQHFHRRTGTRFVFSRQPSTSIPHLQARFTVSTRFPFLVRSVRNTHLFPLPPTSTNPVYPSTRIEMIIKTFVIRIATRRFVSDSILIIPKFMIFPWTRWRLRGMVRGVVAMLSEQSADQT